MLNILQGSYTYSHRYLKKKNHVMKFKVCKLVDCLFLATSPFQVCLTGLIAHTQVFVS